jgi:hypothetical protein
MLNIAKSPSAKPSSILRFSSDEAIKKNNQSHQLKSKKVFLLAIAGIIDITDQDKNGNIIYCKAKEKINKLGTIDINKKVL